MEFLCSLILATAIASSSGLSSPTGIELERVVDNSVELPGITDFFFIQRDPPVPCGGQVIFRGLHEDVSTTGLTVGLYAASPASAEVIANTTTPFPGSPGDVFLATNDPTCSTGGEVFFTGDQDTTPSSGGSSIFGWVGNQLSPYLEVGTSIGSNEVTGFRSLSADAEHLAFIARFVPASTTQSVVSKPQLGDPDIIADQATVLPGQSVAGSVFSQPIADSDEVIFHALTFPEIGIYRWTESEGISIIADNTTPVPALGGDVFSLFGLITTLDEGIVFEASYSAGTGIFIERNGVIEALVVPGDITADGDMVTAAGFPSGAGSLLSFNAKTISNPLEAIFVRSGDAPIERILGVGDTIEGVLVSRVISGSDRSHVAIRIESQDLETQVIYRATFPEAIPAVAIPLLAPAFLTTLVLLLAVAGLLLLRR